jgi:hypothetical protein
MIEGIQVTEDHIGDPVTYIPNHAKGDVNHSDVEHGTISSFNESCVCEIQISMRGEHSDEPISMGIIPAQKKKPPTSNEQRNYTSSGTLTQKNLL